MKLGPPPTPNRKELPFTGSLVWRGIAINIENKEGSFRAGVNKDGEPWRVQMRGCHYGEFAGTEGMDGDAVDVFVGPDLESVNAYVIHTKHPGTRVDDETKVMIGFLSAEKARRVFMDHYTSPGFFNGITKWPATELAEFLRKRGGRKAGRLDTPARVEERLDKAVGSERGKQGGIHELLRSGPPGRMLAVDGPAGQMRVRTMGKEPGSSDSVRAVDGAGDPTRASDRAPLRQPGMRESIAPVRGNAPGEQSRQDSEMPPSPRDDVLFCDADGLNGDGGQTSSQEWGEDKGSGQGVRGSQNPARVGRPRSHMEARVGASNADEQGRWQAPKLKADAGKGEAHSGSGRVGNQHGGPRAGLRDLQADGEQGGHQTILEAHRLTKASAAELYAWRTQPEPHDIPGYGVGKGPKGIVQTAPNFRQSTDEQKCDGCMFAKDGECIPYGVRFAPGSVCDAFSAPGSDFEDGDPAGRAAAAQGAELAHEIHEAIEAQEQIDPSDPVPFAFTGVSKAGVTAGGATVPQSLEGVANPAIAGDPRTGMSRDDKDAFAPVDIPFVVGNDDPPISVDNRHPSGPLRSTGGSIEDVVRSERPTPTPTTHAPVILMRRMVKSSMVKAMPGATISPPAAPAAPSGGGMSLPKVPKMPSMGASAPAAPSLGGGGGIKNRPGLRLDPGIHRWVKTTADQPKAPQGPMAPQEPHPTVGRPVKFHHPDTGETMQGHVTASGPSGATIHTPEGEKHKVLHGNYATHQAGVVPPAVGSGPAPTEPAAPAPMPDLSKPSALEGLRQEHHGLDEGEQQRRYFTDRNTGLLNARGVDAQPHDPKRPMTARFSFEGMKAFNDKFGHAVPDGALRHMAAELGKHIPDGVKRGGDIEGDVHDQAHADKIAEAMSKAIDPSGKIKVFATAIPRQADHTKTLEHLGNTHRDRKDAAVAAGQLGHRLKVPVAFAKHDKPEEAMKGIADRMKAAPTGQHSKLSEHHAQAFQAVGKDKAFDEGHVEKTGLLTDDGFARSHEKNPSHHVASADMRGLQGINDAFGRPAADQILHEFSSLMARNGGGELNAAHPHGDEYLAHHENPEKLREFFGHLKNAADGVAFFMERPDGQVVVQHGLNFVHGVGKDLDEADRVDLARNKQAQGDIKPPAVLGRDEAHRHLAELGGRGVRLVDLGSHAPASIRPVQGQSQGAPGPVERLAAARAGSPAIRAALDHAMRKAVAAPPQQQAMAPQVQAPAAAPIAPPAHPHVGKRVKFRHPDGSLKDGTVAAMGSRGATVHHEGKAYKLHHGDYAVSNEPSDDPKKGNPDVEAETAPEAAVPNAPDSGGRGASGSPSPTGTDRVPTEALIKGQHADAALALTRAVEFASVRGDSCELDRFRSAWEVAIEAGGRELLDEGQDEAFDALMDQRDAVSDLYAAEDLRRDLRQVELKAKDGVQFRSGSPVTFQYARPLDHAAQIGTEDDLGPVGVCCYHLSDHGGMKGPGWDTGDCSFRNPLVIEWGASTTEPHGWKSRLSYHFRGKRGKDLSRAIRLAGYDGVVTVRSNWGECGEILDLRRTVDWRNQAPGQVLMRLARMVGFSGSDDMRNDWRFRFTVPMRLAVQQLGLFGGPKPEPEATKELEPAPALPAPKAAPGALTPAHFDAAPVGSTYTLPDGKSVTRISEDKWKGNIASIGGKDATHHHSRIRGSSGAGVLEHPKVVVQAQAPAAEEAKAPETKPKAATEHVATPEPVHHKHVEQITVGPHMRHTEGGEVVLVEAHQRLVEKTDKPAPKGKRGRAAELDDSGRRIHTDVGEVISGARKHLWSDVSLANLDALEGEGEVEANKHVTKAKVLGEFDVDAQRGMGSSPGAIALKREFYKCIPAKPLPTAQARRDYVRACDYVKRGLDQCHTAKDVRTWIDDFVVMARGYKAAPIMTGQEALAKLGMKEGEHDDYGSGYATINNTRVSLDTIRKHGFEEVGHIHDYGPHGFRQRYQFRTADAAMTDTYGSMVVAFGVDPDTIGGWDATRRRRTGSGNAAMTAALDSKGAFAKHEHKAYQLDREAQANPEKAWAVLGQKAERKTGGGAGKRWVRATENIVRVGGPTVPDAVNGEALQNQFGFRGVQYGNWVDDEHAGLHIKHAWGAMADLADVLGLDPKMIAHEKNLAMAFGARGTGNASAHYEPSKKVINLTHTRGDGSLAHEWGHFMDHVLAEGPFVAEGKELRAPFLSHANGKEKVHPEVFKAAQEVMAAIKRPVSDEAQAEHREAVKAHKERRTELVTQRSGFGTWPARGTPEREAFMAKVNKYNEDLEAHNAQARRMSHGTTKFASDAATLGDYWSRPHELFARAFESYVQDKLEDSGRKNTYLVAGTKNKYALVKKGGTDLEPYPHGAERRQINAAFDKLFEAINTHQALHKAMARRLRFMVRSGPMDPKAESALP